MSERKRSLTETKSGVPPPKPVFSRVWTQEKKFGQSSEKKPSRQGCSPWKTASDELFFMRKQAGPDGSEWRQTGATLRKSEFLKVFFRVF